MPTYMKMPMTPRRQWRNLSGANTGMSSVVEPCSGFAIGMNESIMNAAANTDIAMYITRLTSATFVEAVTWPMSAPTSIGVAVPHSELNVVPIMLSWLPRLPPPPKRLSIGFTTMLSMHTAKPQTNAPKRYTQNGPTMLSAEPGTLPERNWIRTPTKPVAMPIIAVFL